MSGMVADLMRAGKKRLRRAVGRVAPPGTLRRSTLDYLALLFRQGALLPPSRRERNQEPFPDLFDPRVLGDFLRPFGVAAHAVTLHEAACPVLDWYDRHPLVRTVFPLACTPCERGPLLRWLLAHRTRLGLDADAIIAFFFKMALRPDAGLALLYFRHPEWQEAVPDALEPSGWDRLKHWIARRYQVRGRWLDEARQAELAEKDVARHPGVNVLGHFRYPSGLQVAASNTVRALETAGWHVSCRDVPTGRDLPGREDFLGLHPYGVTISQLAPEPFGDDCYRLAGLARRPDTYRIGYWYWELEDAPAGWQRHATWLHELSAPTRFIAGALRRAVSLPVVEMLPGIAPPPEVSIPRACFGLPDDRFLFLTMFDMASTFERKNPLATIAAFRRAFPREAPVALAIKVSRGDSEPANMAALRDAAEPGRVFIVDRLLDPREVAALQACCDAYVALHRSEGFGLPLAEAMALGKPTIATGYSGNLDFMNAGNSLLVDYRKVPIASDQHVYSRGCHWADPIVEHAAAHMRWLVAHPAEARALGERGRRDVLEHLALAAAGRRMAERLSSLTLLTYPK